MAGLRSTLVTACNRAPRTCMDACSDQSACQGDLTCERVADLGDTGSTMQVCTMACSTDEDCPLLRTGSAQTARGPCQGRVRRRLLHSGSRPLADGGIEGVWTMPPVPARAALAWLDTETTLTLHPFFTVYSHPQFTAAVSTIQTYQSRNL